MKEWNAHIEQEIEAIYQLLEQEVINKQFVERHVTELDEIHHQLSERFKALKKTVADFKAAYSWDQELEEAYQGLISSLRLPSALWTPFRQSASQASIIRKLSLIWIVIFNCMTSSCPG